MKTFNEFPEGVNCPICGTNENKETALIPIAGTQEGNTAEAVPIHINCLDFRKENENNLCMVPDIGLVIFRGSWKK